MPLTPLSFEFIRTLLRQQSAHFLEDDKAYLVETRLSPVARRHGFQSVDDLVVRLRARRNDQLIAEVVEAMTINETLFFRDAQPFDVLRRIVLPELVRKRSDARRLNIWSAACASGQEPYSVAILLRDGFPELASWNVRLIASDISAAMLERTRQGRYSDLEASRGLTPDLLASHFHREDGGWRIRDDLRSMLEARQINLSGDWPALPSFDLILLRNVLIYFDAADRRRILRRVRNVLHPDGYLMLGGAETTHDFDEDFVPVTFDQTSLLRPRSS